MSPRSLWERSSHSSKEIQGRGGSFSTSGHGLWMEHRGLLQVLWDQEGNNPKEEVDTLRIPSKNEDQHLGP